MQQTIMQSKDDRSPMPYTEQAPVARTSTRLTAEERSALATWTEQTMRTAHHAAPDRRAELEAEVIVQHLWLPDSLARRFRRRGEEDDDLMQVARRGLIEAVQRYDPDHGSFVSFAVPTITGVLKRHFRDHGWLIRPPRSTQHLAAEVRTAWPTLAQRLGTAPTLTEIARDLGESVEAVREANRASQGYTHASFDLGPNDAAHVVADGPGQLEAAEARLIVYRAWRQLPTDDQRLLVLRFFEERTQSDIAILIGTSQMQVSRRLARLLKQLQTIIGPLEQSSTAA